MSRDATDPSTAKAAAPAPIDLNPRTDPVLDFPDKAYGRLRPDDYAALGFLCGLEVHQQLITPRKLFCRCPPARRTSQIDATVLRHMRPTLSEMGEYDGTALMEFKTKKEIVYLIERSTTCTYDIDDTPPFPVDEEAVRIALEISRMFDLKLVSELHVMRKQYLDGSIPTGFQRTAMVGVGGVIPFRTSELGPRELRIRQLTLEEDSCREVSDVGHRITFRVDRLGTPLIETVTEPELVTPNDVALGGRLIAQVARATGKVRRGPGAARQDVNVSIAGSRRVEIKGVPRHRGLPLLVHNEAYRHLNLLRIREALTTLGITDDLLALPAVGEPWDHENLVVDARAALQHTGYAPIRNALEVGLKILAVRLPGFAGLLAHDTQPGVPFVAEIAERVRVIACPAHHPFLLCSDIGDELTGAEWKALRSALGATDGDAVAVLWASPDDAATGAREVLLRAEDALVGVPSETRQAFADGTTGFERILPGPQRMYPDTDTPPLPIPDTWVETIETGLAERPWQREDRYVEAGVPPATARRLSTAPWVGLFDTLLPLPADVATRVAHALEKRIPYHWRRSGSSDLPAADRLRPMVDAAQTGALHLAAIDACLDSLLRDDGVASEIVARHAPAPDADELLTQRVSAVVGSRDGVAEQSDEVVLRWAMGEVMGAEPRGRIDPGAARRAIAVALELEGADA